MPIPSYGALPLSETFLCVRALSLIAMIGIVGLTANFVAVINGSGIEPPKEIVAIDSLLLLAFVVVSVTLGKPLSLLNCFAIAEVDGKIDATGVAYWLQSLVQNIKQGGSIGLYVWAGTTRINCLETKAIWGLCIALCKRAGLLPKKIEAA
ncbi:unnamed protein product [Aureobasidium pullulans]|nr:unnamed protein product [Aureobasidium pullulans]